MIVMLCTRDRGGIRAVVEAYRRDGFIDAWGVEVVNTHAEGSLAKRIGMFLIAFARFARLLVQHDRIEGVHCHVATRGSVWRKLIFSSTAQAFGIPVILHLHGAETRDYFERQPPWIQRLVTRMIERATAVIVLSDGWKRYVSSIAPRAEIMVICNYVRLPDCVQRPEGDRVRLLFLGEVGRRKGIYELLDAMVHVVSVQPDVRLLVGGKGEVDKARARAEQLGIAGHVEFLGWVAGDQKDDLLRRSDIFVLPSHNEGLPMSVLEAMSWGLPVVSTAVGAIPEVIRSGDEGILVAAGDTNALSAALVKLAASKALRGEMGLNARRRVEREYSMQVVLPRLHRLYETYLSGPAPQLPPKQEPSP